MLLPIVLTVLASTPSDDWRPRNAVQAHLGFASPVGEAGLTYERDLIRALSIELGVGYGISGYQYSGMLRVYPGVDREFFFGAGVSLGSNLDTDSGGVPVPWLNVDLGGAEVRLRSGLVLSVSGGTATALASGHVTVAEVTGNLRGFTTIQLRLGIGGWF